MIRANTSNGSSQVNRQVARGGKSPEPKPLEQRTVLQVHSIPGLNDVPYDVIIENLFTQLSIKAIGYLAQVSKQYNNHVYQANESAKKQLENLKIKPEIEEMIKNSGITGIKMPEGPFHNSIHEMRVLTAFKKKLPNAIEVLKKNKIKDINAKNNDGMTPLHVAAENREAEAVKALIYAGANENAQDDYGATPLHVAAENREAEAVKALIYAGADLDAQDNLGWTPLHKAAINGQKEIAEALIDARADVNAQDNTGDTPLHWVAFEGHTEVAKALIKGGADVNAQSNGGDTPLRYAILFEKIEVVEILTNLKIKPKIEEMIKNSGITGIKMPEGPFHNSIHEMRVLTAFKKKLPNAIEVLKKNKIKDINAKNNDRMTPLHVAAENREAEAVKALIDAGADLDAQDNLGWTPLHKAAINGQKEIAEALIDARADVNVQDTCGWTPLHWVAFEGHTEVAKALIKGGADVNVQSNDRMTPLRFAVQKGQQEIVEILIAETSCFPVCCTIM